LTKTTGLCISPGLEFVSWKSSRLEKIESLEQLRVLENGYSIKVIKTAGKTLSVDTPNDVKVVERILKKRHE
jgi:3-deoxy-manno-octulosonate cytidylyltransferase (CMP-KDO synthetase)